MQVHHIRSVTVEYYNAATASVMLSWSSNSQAKQVIPSINFYPANQPDPSVGVDLMEGLQFNGKCPRIVCMDGGVIRRRKILRMRLLNTGAWRMVL